MSITAPKNSHRTTDNREIGIRILNAVQKCVPKADAPQLITLLMVTKTSLSQPAVAELIGYPLAVFEKHLRTGLAQLHSEPRFAALFHRLRSNL